MDYLPHRDRDISPMFTPIPECGEMSASALLDAFAMPVAVLDARGIIVEANTAWRHDARESIGISYTQFLAAHYGNALRDAEIVQYGVREVIAGRQEGWAGECMWRGTGAGRWLAIRVRRVPGSDPLRVMVTHEDVTNRVRTQDAYRLANQIIAETGIAIVVADSLQPNLPLIYVNEAFEQMTGYPAAEILGKNIRILLKGDVRQEAVREIRNALREERRCSVVLRNYRKDGTPFWNSLVMYPIHDDAGRVTHIVAMQTDITERLRVEDELRAAKIAADDASRAKSEFLANMSHEIRTPMNGVIGMTGLLLDTELSLEQREYAETIRTSGEALLTVINDILDFSKIESGKLDLEEVPVNIRDCIESALDLLATPASQKGLDLAYQIEDDVPSSVMTDVTRLRQVVVNLLSNAIKFTQQGEVVVLVSTSKQPGGQHTLHFAVHDTGIGIPPSRMDRLFRSFSQVDASTTRRYGGTGLGLAISKRLAEMMGGTMWAESTEGNGSTFHFTISASPAPAQHRVFLQGSQPQLMGKRLLIVDDNATNRRILTLQARSWGMRAREAMSGAEALEIIERGDPFDLAVLDMQMPEMDGVTLAVEIRKHRSPAQLPLIMLTSMGRKEEGEQVRLAAFAGFLTKPVKQSHLHDILLQTLGATIIDAPTHRDTILDPQMADHHPLRILVTEDNAVNQKLALRVLEKMGYRADIAANGLEAIEAVARQSYDLILMDVQMPEMDGLEATRRICARWPRAARPRIIAMTAEAMQGDREVCLDAGMDGYISKPIQLTELVKALGETSPLGGAHIDSAATPLLDPDALAALWLVVDNDPAEMGDLIGSFFDDTPKQLAAMRVSYAANDGETLQRAAHTLKSSGAIFGAATLSAACADLEATAKTGAIADVPAMLARISSAYDATVIALEIARVSPPV